MRTSPFEYSSRNIRRDPLRSSLRLSRLSSRFGVASGLAARCSKESPVLTNLPCATSNFIRRNCKSYAALRLHYHNMANRPSKYYLARQSGKVFCCRSESFVFLVYKTRKWSGCIFHRPNISAGFRSAAFSVAASLHEEARERITRHISPRRAALIRAWKMISRSRSPVTPTSCRRRLKLATNNWRRDWPVPRVGRVRRTEMRRWKGKSVLSRVARARTNALLPPPPQARTPAAPRHPAPRAAAARRAAVLMKISDNWPENEHLWWIKRGARETETARADPRALLAFLRCHKTGSRSVICNEYGSN